DIDPQALNYKTGDEFLSSAQGRSNQQVVLMDNTGRSYSLAAHTLPSARGQGDPLSGYFTPPANAVFAKTIMAADKQFLLMSSSWGYGFICQFSELLSRTKTGKAIVTLSKGGELLTPRPVNAIENSYLAAVTSEGYLLIIKAEDLPQLSRGKGNKIINVPAAKLKTGEESVVAVVALHDDMKLVVHAGKQHKMIRGDELQEYIGERGKRGKLLPKGYRNVSRLDVQA
ncbi:MAG: DNA gyrase C-terminal beta-propeller domain-containing protein, partial [Leucothrix sp.]